ncbi:hypothetical protein [Paenibacillus sp. XY044]|uniref:hypothetical protein n=1 Tax=Paenibacillus sp. XY044 TaxID=2026089 RepID=UPI000B9809A7|nr:hypothetical protein [Paenibacillus sp. XY044]OZB96702.1 hypothetical protein CJP46_12625 [Paenibacillus sp. XY044]
MNRTAGVMKIHLRDKWVWMYVPWVVMLFSFAVNLVIGVLTRGEEPINSGGVVTIYVYMFVAILIVQAQTFPFALGLNIRRTDYFVGTTAMALLVSAVSSVLLLGLGTIEQLTNAWGVQLHYFHLPFLKEVSPLGRLGIYFIVMTHMFFMGFVISSIFRRFGRIGMFVFFIALIVLSSIGSFAMTYYGLWLDFFRWIGVHYMNLFLWMIPLTLIYALLSYLLLRRATVS